MGQQEVYNYLKKHRGWVTVTEISKAIKSKKNNVRLSLRAMLKYKEVDCKEIKIDVKGQYPRDKRRVEHWKLV